MLMRIHDPQAYRTATEIEILSELLEVRGKRILELGCGAAWMTRLLRDRFAPARIIATEVDRIQHEKNLAGEDRAGIEFRLGGAEAIDLPDASMDAVFLFKSLHHVPLNLLDQSLQEIHRVLVPGGSLYCSEPVYWGPFNELMRLIHDEKKVREAAFQALVRAVEAGLFRSEREVFFQVPGTFENWDAFAERFLRVTHTQLDLDAAQIQRIRTAFSQHLGPEGAHFLKPHRVDLLRKTAGKP